MCAESVTDVPQRRRAWFTVGMNTHTTAPGAHAPTLRGSWLAAGISTAPALGIVGSVLMSIREATRPLDLSGASSSGDPMTPMLVLLLSFLVAYALAAAAVAHVLQDERLSGTDKVAWTLALVAFAPLMLPAYWHIRLRD